jgi:hypothetical protein
MRLSDAGSEANDPPARKPCFLRKLVLRKDAAVKKAATVPTRYRLIRDVSVLDTCEDVACA